jgi:hypothetical protein
MLETFVCCISYLVTLWLFIEIEKIQLFFQIWLTRRNVSYVSCLGEELE